MNHLDETWAEEDGRVYSPSSSCRMFVVDCARDNVAAARLAACAPEAIRMLLAAEWQASDEGSPEGFCPWCEHRRAHGPACAWLALMRKAGVRE